MFNNRAIAILVMLAVVSCGRSNAPVEVTESRAVSAPEAQANDTSSSAERFGSHAKEAPADQIHSSQAAKEYQWDVPQDWETLPAKPMRLVSLSPGGNPSVECYVTVLSGLGGGVAANINRWRHEQMGQSTMTEDEIAALPKISMLGQQAPMVEITGAYTGMTGETRNDYIMLGAVCATADSTLFVKMTGPEAEVRAQKDNFIAFCQSLRPGAPEEE